MGQHSARVAAPVLQRGPVLTLMVATVAVTFACGSPQVAVDTATADTPATTATPSPTPIGGLVVDGELPFDDGYDARSWGSAAAAPSDSPGAEASAPAEAATARPTRTTPAQPNPLPTTPVPAPPSPVPAVSSPTTSAPPVAPTTATPIARDLLVRSVALVATAAADGTITEGTARALTAHLDAALATIADSSGVSACGSLGALVNLVSAQYAKDIPATLADQLIGAARTARDDLSCS